MKKLFTLIILVAFMIAATSCGAIHRTFTSHDESECPKDQLHKNGDPGGKMRSDKPQKERRNSGPRF